MQVMVDSSVSEFFSIAKHSVEVALRSTKISTFSYLQQIGTQVLSLSPSTPISPNLQSAKDKSDMIRFSELMQIPRQIRESMQQIYNKIKIKPIKKTKFSSKKQKQEKPRSKLVTILRYKRIIRCTQVNKPVPFATFPKQQSGGVEGIGDHGGPTVGHKIGLCDHPDISDLLEDGVTGDEVSEIIPFLRRRGGFEMNDVTEGVKKEEDTREEERREKMKEKGRRAEAFTGEERVVKKRRRREKEEPMAIGRIHLRSKAGGRRRKELENFIFRLMLLRSSRTLKRSSTGNE
ncbi:hypothetical protein M5K25_014397 [Dendrobium thyrsiflorum]|uniref:Uncharacterized protein n=1 Tax=Dendrobium thyrsiflorum TaxID=117978 RepID=A0ABD0UWD6_DENTH